MAEYYSKEAVVEFIRSYRHSTDVAFHTEDHLYEIPAADVRPAVKARWIGEGDGYADGEMVYDVLHCSNCDYTVDEGDNEPPRYNFCPNCGAKMEMSEE